uniref:Uncharacterized protein n=1 Tax=Cannabis sativa TaxID=3483 RepID=A0A803NT02_CANSA
MNLRSWHHNPPVMKELILAMSNLPKQTKKELQLIGHEFSTSHMKNVPARIPFGCSIDNRQVIARVDCVTTMGCEWPIISVGGGNGNEENGLNCLTNVSGKDGVNARGIPLVRRGVIKDRSRSTIPYRFPNSHLKKLFTPRDTDPDKRRPTAFTSLKESVPPHQKEAIIDSIFERKEKDSIGKVIESLFLRSPKSLGKAQVFLDRVTNRNAQEGSDLMLNVLGVAAAEGDAELKRRLSSAKKR